MIVLFSTPGRLRLSWFNLGQREVRQIQLEKVTGPLEFGGGENDLHE